MSFSGTVSRTGSSRCCAAGSTARRWSGFAKLPPARIGLEACGASHYGARVLRALGHAVVLPPPQSIKPYRKRGTNDALDAEAICEAMSRPSMRFVPVKSAERQAALMMLRTRDLLVKQRTMLINAIC
jgi:transposase